MQISDYKKAYELCVYCPKMCRFACPVSEATGRETLTPWGKMSAGHFKLLEKLSIEDVVQSAFACTACGACTEYCDWDNDVASALVALRAEGLRAEASRVEIGGLTLLDDDGKPLEQTVGFERLLDTVVPASLLDEDRNTVYIPSPDQLARGEKPLGAIVKVLEHLGSRVAIYPHPVRLGLDLYWAGATEDFVEMAADFAETFEDYECLIFSNSAWVWAVRELFEEFGIDLAPDVLHVSEWLAALVEENVITRRQTFDQPATYHDPCFLGRRLEVTEEPRQVLEFCGVSFTELGAHELDTVCCGAEALLPSTWPDAAEAMANDRLREPRERSLTVISADPRCIRHLTGHGVEILDLFEVVARCL